MLQYVHVQKLDEFASRDCGRARVRTEIRDSIGPAIAVEVTNRIAMAATRRFNALKRIGTPHRPPSVVPSEILRLNFSDDSRLNRIKKKGLECVAHHTFNPGNGRLIQRVACIKSSQRAIRDLSGRLNYR